MATPKILLTGATGYLGAHVLDVLLKQGYNVRITARSRDKADATIARFSQFKSQLEYSVVPDFTASNAYDNSLEGITGIIHTASPIASNFVSNEFEKDLLIPAILGTTTILKAAFPVKSVKRVVITSSVAAVLTGDFNKVYTEKDWNPITYEEAKKGPAFIAYSASKKLAEEAAWDFVKKEKPHFAVTAIVPPFLYGPLAYPVENAEDFTGTLLKSFHVLENKFPAPLDTYVDVRDAALAHVLALEKPVAANQRYLLHAGSYSSQELADIARKNFPGKTRAEIGTPGVYPAPVFKADTSKVYNQLGLVYRSKEDTFKDSFAQLADLRAKGKDIAPPRT